MLSCAGREPPDAVPGPGDHRSYLPRWKQARSTHQYRPAIRLPVGLHCEAEHRCDAGTRPQKIQRSTIQQMLDFAQRSALVTISPQTNLSFRHELIAEFFVAEYLRRSDAPPHSGVPLADELLADIGGWSEPVSIWAGMIDDPLDLARRLAALGQHRTTYAYAALAL